MLRFERIAREIALDFLFVHFELYLSLDLYKIGKTLDSIHLFDECKKEIGKIYIYMNSKIEKWSELIHTMRDMHFSN